MSPNLEIPVTPEQYETAGSKFITLAESEKEAYRTVEFQEPSWKTPNKSLNFPFVITQGVDKGKEDAMYPGVDEKGVWKLKEILDAMGVPINMVDTPNGKRPSFDTDLVKGKKAVVYYLRAAGTKGGDPMGEPTNYPKATTVYPEGFSPPSGANLGI